MSVGTTAAIAIAAGVGAAGSIGSSLIGKSAASSASDKQVAADTSALDFQKQQYADTKANQAPYLDAGKQSLSKILDSINNGTFGPGSIPQPAAFKAPTLQDAQNDPGYQFTAQQGSKGILQGAAAAGGAVSGGTLKALSSYNANLADSTYGNVFNRNLATYNAGLSDYQAKLAGQAQGYNQLSNIAGLGQTATQNVGQVGVATGSQVGSTLSNLGTAQASGIVGGANAVTGGIGSISNLAQFYGLGGGSIYQPSQQPGNGQLPYGQTYNVPQQFPSGSTSVDDAGNPLAGGG